MDNAKRTYKDSVFRSRFSNPKDLAAIHSLITGSPTKPEDITINTLKHVFFRLERNDISYLVKNHFIVLFEEQSSLNQNMPLRMLVYITMLYRRLLKRRDFFRESRIPLLMPEFYEFYCGTKEQPLVSTLRLSDSFPKGSPFPPPLELVVTRYNIGYNEDASKCSELFAYKPVKDYSFFVYDVRQRMASGEMLANAVRSSIEYCIDHDIMKEFLIDKQKEVLDMYNLRWNERAAREAAMEDGRLMGLAEGETKGEAKGESRLSHLIALLLKNGKSDEIAAAVENADVRQSLYAKYGIQ
ncbi:MAG: Rpn family recombination-promoting nuclease/putative transposase [Selenomonadaceae bacterium]|nr:Rpn family recombination-promoting nuclease/putative transposase [Selenomonadaceae bacterium]